MDMCRKANVNRKPMLWLKDAKEGFLCSTETDPYQANKFIFCNLSQPCTVILTLKTTFFFFFLHKTLRLMIKYFPIKCSCNKDQQLSRYSRNSHT